MKENGTDFTLRQKGSTLRPSLAAGNKALMDPALQNACRCSKVPGYFSSQSGGSFSSLIMMIFKITQIRSPSDLQAPQPVHRRAC